MYEERPVVVEALRRDELDRVVAWAAGEGWNPGRSDVRIAWDLQPQAFLALRQGDRLVGVGTIFRHDVTYGFMGLFIVDPELRGQGLGAGLWTHRRDLLLSRLRPGATIGMDGVVALTPFYRRGGFTQAYRNLRMQGVAGHYASGAVALTVRDLEAIEALDRPTFPVRRTDLLRRWIDQPGAVARGIIRDKELTAWAMCRPCAVGHKLGPVVAIDSGAAREAVASVLDAVAGDQVQLDVPEVNADALALASEFGLDESFACARMYLGPPPSVDLGSLYGVTSFEFG